MIYVSLPDNTPRPLPFYLAMEEWLARNSRDDLFFMWQVDPTVICGRNQIVDLEVDLDYCRKNNINVCRRKSGGGCVFADRNNIMFSFITSSSSVTTTFAAYTGMVAAMLRDLGMNASSTSRNDVLIDGLKVSGNAFYHLPGCGRCIVHGTMLYDADITAMCRAITPSRAKLESKGVASVASRITTIRSHSAISLENFKSHTRSQLCGDRHLVLSAADVADIELLAGKLTDDAWVFRKTSDAAVRRHSLVAGAGEFTAHIDTDGSLIRSINLSGDFFLIAELDTALLDKLRGVEYTRTAIADALSDTDVRAVIAGLDNEKFINILI
ncbi:MAG: lipoyltransferase [Muribaculaceae bacterium]|nr:lipoyltransferase [Muribaculaceae bacterium]